ncbi:MAG: TRAP transporter small permease subunit [Sphaerochaetaceae bacterium]|nr:TRAP transporter small permease subunit [Sphaerochaetaceae bacterium]
MKKAGAVLSKAVDRFEVTILVVSTAALAILLIINVIMRNVYRSIHFAEELSRLFIMLITFVGTSYAARKARHIRMGALLELLPTKVEKVLIIIISIISAAIFFILGAIALEYVIVLYQRQTVTSSLRAPYWTFVLIAPIGLFMASFQYVRTVIKNFKEEEVWLSPEQKGEFEDEAVMLEEAKASMTFGSELPKEST